MEGEDAKKTSPHKILRQLRDSLVELFIALTRALFFWIPGGDMAKGRALMACHPIFITIIIAFFFVAAPRSAARIGIALFSILVMASQWLLGGCVVTRAEQSLTGSKETILDPFLTLAGVQVNRDTRVSATLGTSTAITLMLVWAVTCDAFRTH
jgi:hypothetical protein